MSGCGDHAVGQDCPVHGPVADCWDGGDESRIAALMAENERLRAELRHIADMGTGSWSQEDRCIVDRFGEPWTHWATRAKMALSG